jgi:hypothetical protein
MADLPGLRAVMQNLDLVTSMLQESIMQTRLQPISVVFSKFPRIIRDLAKKLGKEAELTLVGQDVELDKSIIELLSDPLTHLIRNSVDHGIELPDRRAAAGKNRTGQVVLRAYHEGGKVNIQIRDDGGGIDTARVRAKAVEKKLITPEAAAFSLNTNQVSDIVTTKYGFHIIKLSEKIPAQKVEFAKAASDIKDGLTQQSLQKLFPEYLAKLKKEAGVEILDEKLKPKEMADSPGLPAGHPPVKAGSK